MRAAVFTVQRIDFVMGVDVIYRAILREGLSRYAFDMGAVYGLTCWRIDTLVKFGSPAQKDTYIAPALAGKVRFSISMTEPNAGSDLTRIGMRWPTPPPRSMPPVS